jgi:serine/threonine protein kinase
MKEGDRLGTWVLARQLGRGMIASTWLADRTGEEASPALDAASAKGGSRAVLKILDLSDMKDWSVADLFRREAEALKTLKHPGIPAFIESFEAPDGERLRLVLAMQYMEGDTLEALVRSGRRFEDREVAAILAGIADILDYLSSIRPPVVHRDVNPRNILLGPENAISLVDFSGARDAVRAALYPGATLVGTAGYTAVEQVAGKASTRSDLYGAAATAVFLLTGLNPSELPVKDMKIDLSGLVTPSPALACVLDSWLESDQTKRNLSAVQAAAILRGGALPTVKPAPGNGIFDMLAGEGTGSLRSRLFAALTAQAEARIADATGGNDAGPVATLPSDSRVRIERSDSSLSVTIPPERQRASGIGIGVFAAAWLGFVAFWTFMAIAMGAPFFFPMFSIPFWIVGIFMASTGLKSAFGSSILRISPEGLVYTERLFGRGKTRSWPLSDAGRSSIGVSPMEVQGERSQEIIVEAGTARLKIGSGLSPRELACINREIGEAIRDFSRGM